VIDDYRMGRQALTWRPIVRLAVAVVLLATAGCKALGPGRPLPPQRQRDILTRDEILSSTARQGDLLQAIHSLRPNFLAVPRGVYSPTSPTSVPIAVYVDRVRQSDLASLRSISATKVAEVRYLDPTEALNEFGPTAGGGAILVRMFDPSKDPSSSSAIRLDPSY